MITPKYYYEVTRTWYVKARNINEAISKSKQILHTEVQATKMEEKENDTSSICGESTATAN